VRHCRLGVGLEEVASVRTASRAEVVSCSSENNLRLIIRQVQQKGTLIESTVDGCTCLRGIVTWYIWEDDHFPMCIFAVPLPEAPICERWCSAPCTLSGFHGIINTDGLRKGSWVNHEGWSLSAATSCRLVLHNEYGVRWEGDGAECRWRQFDQSIRIVSDKARWVRSQAVPG